jgi:tetratricopeptide (TPR) repeat protein
MNAKQHAQAHEYIAKGLLPDYFALMHDCVKTTEDKNTLSNLEADHIANTINGRYASRLQTFTDKIFRKSKETNLPKKLYSQIVANKAFYKDFWKLLKSKNVIWQGAGGVGKTTFARVFATEFEAEFHAVVWVHAPNDWHQLDFIKQQMYLKTRASKAGKKSLLVIDDLQMGQEDALEELATNFFENWSIIVTTRLQLKEYDLRRIFNIKPFATTNETAYKIFWFHYNIHEQSWWDALMRWFSPPKANQDLQDFCTLVQNHVLCIELVAKAVSKSHKTLAEINTYLRQQKLEALDTEVETEYIKTQTTIYNCLTFAFEDAKKLQGAEQDLLQKYTLLPTGYWTRYAWVGKLQLDTTPYRKAEDDLIRKGWVEEEIVSATWWQTLLRLKPKPKIQYYHLHPLVREVLHHLLAYTWTQHENLLAYLQEHYYETPSSLPTAVQVLLDRAKVPPTGDLAFTLGDFFYKLHQYDMAIRLFDIALAQYEQTDNKDNAGVVCSRLGDIYMAVGKIEEATVYYQKDYAISQILYQTTPQEARYQQGLALACGRLGDLYLTEGKFTEAFRYFEESHQYLVNLMEAYPQEPAYKDDVATTYQRLGNLCQTEGKFAEALVYYQQEHQLFEELHQTYPHEPTYQYLLALAYQALGIAYSKLEKKEETLAHFQQFYALIKTLQEAYPQNVEYLFALGGACSMVGNMLRYVGQRTEGLARLEEGHHIWERLVHSFPAEVEMLFRLGESFRNLGGFYHTENAQQAEVYYRQGLAIAQGLVRDYAYDVSHHTLLADIEGYLAELLSPTP